MDIRDKKLSETEIRAKYINPALYAKGWDDSTIIEEYCYTDGRIVVHGNLKTRSSKKIADYVLLAKDNYPIAVIEAKSYKYMPDQGLQQAMEYAHDLDIPFAYSTNGEKFVEHDMRSAAERSLEMNEFPTREELLERLKKDSDIKPSQEFIKDSKYYSDANSYEPRYYQRIAINKTIDAIARGEKRILLVMATGTGKTYTAFQIIHRLHSSGIANRILYLADRNALIDQTMQQDFKPFSSFMSKVQGKEASGSSELLMSLYGQWFFNEKEKKEKEDEDQPYKKLRSDYFDLILIDECHRSSSNENKQWHELLLHFSDAIQIGMTATPVSKEGIDNIKYFNEPLFTYSLQQGINDGFLAPYTIINAFFNVDESGYITKKGEKDKYGYPIYEELFTQNQFGKSIQIIRRQIVVAKRITEMLKKIGRMTKTIVFCTDEEEAMVMRTLLVEMNRDKVAKYPDYVTRITSSERHKTEYLEKFISVYSPTPVIATTSQLLTTGVDTKSCGLIVIDKPVESKSILKQMIGRGTRVVETKSVKKMNFYILDFRNVTSMMDDKDFDDIVDRIPYDDNVLDDLIEPKKPKEPKQFDTPSDTPDTPKRIKYHVEGDDVHITREVVRYLGADGKTLNTESYTDFSKIIKNRYPTLDVFKGSWRNADKKAAILAELEGDNVILDVVREANPALKDCDDFDIICHLAFGQKPLTRRERINNVKKRGYLAKYNDKAREVLDALMEKYGDAGVKDIENATVLNLPSFRHIGTRPRIINGIFKGMDDYNDAIRELEEQLYKEA